MRRYLLVLFVASSLPLLTACGDDGTPRTAEAACAAVHVGQDLRSVAAAWRKIPRSIITAGDLFMSIQLRGEDGRWRMCTLHHAGSKVTDLAVSDAPP